MGKRQGWLAKVFGGMLPPAADAAAQANLAGFWDWFSRNQAAYLSLDPADLAATKRLFDDLAGQLRKIEPDLVFEFGPLVEGRRDFVISAGGIRTAFPAVIALARDAPAMDGWNIIAFRPRRAPMHPIAFKGLQIDPHEVQVQIAHDGERLALRIFIPGYSEQEYEKFATAGYLLLDQALGEYDVETKVSGIEFRALEFPPPVKAIMMSELGAVFDRLYPATVH